MSTRRSGVLRSVVLVVFLLLFLTPLVASAAFGFTLPGRGLSLEPLRAATGDASFGPQLWLTAQLTALTTVGSLVLLVPTLVWLHLKFPRILPTTEAVSVVPMVVPAVALVSGANLFFRLVAPGFLVSVYSLVPFYVVVTLPLVYRTLDAGIRAMDLRTLVDASTSLGAGMLRTVLTVLLPNMRVAVLNAVLLLVTAGVGEYALASLLLHNTFPVFLAQIGANQPRAAAALSFIVIVGTWLLLYLITAISDHLRRRRSRSE